jgi:hypothetical protein
MFSLVGIPDFPAMDDRPSRGAPAVYRPSHHSIVTDRSEIAIGMIPFMIMI